MMNRAILMFLFLLGTGCATMNKDLCQSVDWYDVGHADGSRGQKAEYFEKHAGSCDISDHESTRKLYLAGREQGLKEYCSPRGAYEAGRSGDLYMSVCPKEFETTFVPQLRTRPKSISA
jgi:hypothetical protein